MSLPTKLTLLRIVLTFLLMGLLAVPGAAAKAGCLAIFLLAAATDWADGYLARRWHQTSRTGVLLDPIADKILVLGTLLMFVQLSLISAWMVLVILIRELGITGVRLYAAGRQIVIPAAREGKHKTVSQMATITVILLLLVARELLHGDAARQLATWMPAVIAGCMWGTVMLTVISGMSFFWRNRAVWLEASR